MVAGLEPRREAIREAGHRIGACDTDQIEAEFLGTRLDGLPERSALEGGGAAQKSRFA